MNTPDRRRLGPTWYFVLGIVWTALAIGQWGISDSMIVKVGFTFLAVANLGMGFFMVRKQRSESRRDNPGG